MVTFKQYTAFLNRLLYWILEGYGPRVRDAIALFHTEFDTEFYNDYNDFERQLEILKGWATE